MTKVVYIPAKVKNASIRSLMAKVDIKENFGIVTTVQHLDEVNQLEGYTILGQVLGCNPASAKNDDVDAILYIGSGLFHPLNLAFSLDKPVYILDPIKKEFYKLDDSVKEKYEARKRGMMAKFYASKKIGVIVSLKSGQNNMKRAELFMTKFPEKQMYMFLCDNVKDLENYPDIQCWVNTACIRIFEDDLNVPLVNIRDVDTKGI